MTTMDLSFDKVEESSAAWRIPENLAFFEGHFPEQPILPAVIIMDASLQLVRTIQNQPNLQIQKVVSSKFLGPILPNMDVKLEAREVAPCRWQIDWQLQVESRDLAKIELLLDR